MSEYYDVPAPEVSADLPPHAPEAERAVLGCILYEVTDAVERMNQALEYFREEQPFYDLRHAEILQAMKALHAQGKPLDLISLHQFLVDCQKINAVGGREYLFGLPDGVASPSMLPEYLAMIWEKHLARKGIQASKLWRDRFMTGLVSEAGLEEMTRELERLKMQSAQYLERHPQNLGAPMDFEKEYFATWFHEELVEPGYHLPFEFPLKIRPSELTLVTGDNGTGKSSLLGHICVSLGCQGVKMCIASLEVPPHITLWILARQLLGIGWVQKDEAGIKKVAQALGWLQNHVRIYNFLGITDWRALLDTFIYARKHYGTEIFVVDSVMRIGIQDDDYAMQGVVAARFADFAVTTGAHLFLVIHENKSSRDSMKDKVRGSKQWTDNAHNVVGMRRNEEKADAVDELEELLRTKQITPKEYDEDMRVQAKLWDAKFLMSKQRYPGSRQNGSKFLWFDKASLQFMPDHTAKPTNYFEKWMEAEKQRREEQQKDNQ